MARLNTLRTTQRLFASDGTALADFSDDRVDSQTMLEPPAHTAGGNGKSNSSTAPGGCSRDADTLLAGTGHHPSALPSKLARGLGEQYPPGASLHPRPARTLEGPASAVLLSYLGKQVEALKRHDPGVRENAPDAVHQLRVAARRMRSALATFRKLADPDVTGSLRSELKWLAGTVGEARDNEVMRARLLDLIGAEPPDLLLGQVARQVEEHFDAAAHGARAKGLAALKSARYFRLLDSLDAFLAEPPLTETAGKDTLQTVGRLVSKQRKRLKKHVRALHVESDGPAADAALHEVRKSAKRLRYAAEAAAPVFGKRATTLARAAEEIQEILGDHQDSVVTRALLRELAANPSWEERLHLRPPAALEQQAGEESREKFFRGLELVPTRAPPLEVGGWRPPCVSGPRVE